MMSDEFLVVDPFTDEYIDNEAFDNGYVVQQPYGRQFSENYGNPKNKKYTLTATPGQVVRLTTVDGQVLYEGTGEEAVNKAADIVDSLNQAYGSGATWKLQTKPEGASDFSTVSQDTVAKDKKTALNSFLDVALPLAGGLLIPGLGLLGGVAGAAAGAGGASLINSTLQNQSLDDAIKTALINAAGAGIGNYAGGQIAGALQGAGSAGSELAKAGGALVNANSNFVGSGALDALAQSFGQGAGQTVGQTAGQLAGQAVAPIVVNAATQGVGNVLGTAAGAGLGSVLAGGFTPVSEVVVNAQPTQPNTPIPGVTVPTEVSPVVVNPPTQQPDAPIPGVTVPTEVSPVVVTPPTQPNTPVPGVTLPTEVSPVVVSPPTQQPTQPTVPDSTEVSPVVVNPPTQPTTPVVVPPDSTEVSPVVVNPPAKPTPPTVDTLVIPPVPSVTGGTVNTTPTSPTNKPLDWKDVIPLIGAVIGGTTGGSGNTTFTGPSYEPGTAPGQPGSLTSVFRDTLPVTNLNMTPRDMGDIDWNRYGFGPEKSFFTNVPQRFAKGGYAVTGVGTGRSDSIDARLSDGEYVVDAETVALLGDGSSKAGARKLDELRVKVRKAKGKDLAKGKFSVKALPPEHYMRGGRS